MSSKFQCDHYKLNGYPKRIMAENYLAPLSKVCVSCIVFVSSPYFVFWSKIGSKPL